jgi:hypothetical protein
MISRDQMFEPMLAACPSFAPAWAKFCAEWEKELGDPFIKSSIYQLE